MANKYYANRGIERNKRPLKNIIYTVTVLKLSEFKNNPTPDDIKRLEQYKFKDLGYIWLDWKFHGKSYLTFTHGFITPDKLKHKIGIKQWEKFCQGKREFIIQRRIDKHNIQKEINQI